MAVKKVNVFGDVTSYTEVDVHRNFRQPAAPIIMVNK
jgi:hypothetical protein